MCLVFRGSFLSNPKFGDGLLHIKMRGFVSPGITSVFEPVAVETRLLSVPGLSSVIGLSVHSGCFEMHRC